MLATGQQIILCVFNQIYKYALEIYDIGLYEVYYSGYIDTVNAEEKVFVETPPTQIFPVLLEFLKRKTFYIIRM